MFMFMFWMLLASSLGFFKFIALAAVLDVSDYGQYVAIFGLSTLVGTIISFGSVERSIKIYPRMWVKGNYSNILKDASAVTKTLLMRFSLLAAVGLGLTFVEKVSFDWIEVVCFCLLGLGSAWLSLLASLYRASGLRKALQNFSFWRTGLAFLLTFIGGNYLGWIGAMGGDILASILTCIYALFTVRKIYAQATVESSESERDESGGNEGGHGRLYVANMMTASTTMIDRFLIGASLGASTAGSYGVIMLIPQISQMLVNIVSQYIGPMIIKFVHQGHEDKSNISAIGLQGLIVVLLSSICVGSLILCKHITFIDSFITKFSISDMSLILAGIIAAGQIYSLIEFHLIAYDGEHLVLIASMLSTGLFFSLFFLVAQYSLSVEYFVGAAALSRWLQVVILTYAFLNRNQLRPRARIVERN